MTTLTVYFASSSSTSLPSSSSQSSSSASNSNNTNTVIPSTVTPPVSRLVPITSKSMSVSPDLPSITLPNPSSTTNKPTQLPSRTPSKRNKTFFERFNQSSSTTLTSTPQSPSYQQPHSMDSPNPPPSDQPTRLRRRFTFRRSLRHSVQNNKGGDFDDGIRSVAVLSNILDLSISISIFT